MKTLPFPDYYLSSVVVSVLGILLKNDAIFQPSRSIGRYAVVLYCVILNLRAILRMRLLTRLEPWSVNIALGGSSMHKNFFMNASATYVAVVCSRGIATRNFVSRSWIVRM